ncbi:MULTISPECIES: substrate-binding domain-containing protein [Burkholderiaceae]|jgi:ribose transport system substrate-binding protein|uniref:Ribose ABC transporter, periplasmic ribose-binding protein RbsB n=1 Tax=Caballeronia sordidicola TaxID=196367 RepID=A0A242MJ91_CABSO|nr:MULTISPECIES: substrate-binding domain-containing protein [Burkholderiaceae]MDP9153576.1 substrate-binding domain-containing protein [Pseudomonadota bacterium]AME24010.1 sugar ABC transporter substrate-binding protein [Burkholderia sp. PAMC 26561]AMM13219.1 sugar ABC transporter substrate-binding protein [Burkholderia sp. PAMC 28687]OTP70209.1 Ribose ABC transporter, periplasmic ribose-binding protein RbsB [Caballeronia sordidicola]OTP71379.1 Ribose ABC transporter, periplasmic ribose-bindi
MFRRSVLAVLVTAVAATAAHAADVKIGASLLTQQHPFYVELANAMKAEAAKDHAQIDIAIANQDLSKQIADVQDFVTKKVDVIVISPVDSKGVKAAVLTAEKAGIPVITVDISAAGVEVASHIATDNYAGGLQAGALMCKVLGGKGKVGVIDYPTIQSVIDRVTGFKKALAACPDVKIVAIQPGITRADALSAAQNMLQANPDLAGIFGFGDDAAMAAAVAGKSAGNKVKVIGFDGMPEARAAVDKNPNFVGVIRQYPDKMGALAVDTAVKVAAKQAVPKLQPVTPGQYLNASVK